MAGPTLEEMQKAFATYVTDRRILVADPSSGSRTSVVRILRELGAKASNLTTSPSFDGAIADLDSMKPNIVITDYNLGKQGGLRLMQRLRKHYPNPRDTLFILVTSNCRESSIAEAAEEDVDGYILKPFSVEIFRDNFLKAAYAKINPSSYQLQIQEGKAALLAQNAEKAEIFFETALTLVERPILAHYYHGQSCVMSKKYPRAEKSYLQGLALNELHYRCLRGMLELHVLRGETSQAYPIARMIVEHYPISPGLLGQVLRLAVKTGGFEDIDDYYLVYTHLDERSPELVKVMGAALIVAGRFHLGKRHLPRAVELFKRALITTARGPGTFREIVNALLKANQPGLANQFLKEYPPADRGSRDYQVLDLQILNALGTRSQVINIARDLITQGAQEIEVYEIVIKRSLEAGYKDSAEDYAHQASKAYPALKERFMALLHVEAPATK
jgi:two-component system chemotaxis response regulator CheY